MLDRNWDIIGALEQRSDALLGVDFDVQPGGPSEEIEERISARINAMAKEFLKKKV